MGTQQAHMILYCTVWVIIPGLVGLATRPAFWPGCRQHSMVPGSALNLTLN